jgi:TctA family transporter
VALFMTTIASFVGSMLGILVLVLFSPSIAELGLKFGPAEYFAMMLLGLIAASTWRRVRPPRAWPWWCWGCCWAPWAPT